MDQEVATLTQALAGLKPVTQVGSLAENDVKALVEDKPSLEIVEKTLILDLWNGPIQISLKENAE